MKPRWFVAVLILALLSMCTSAPAQLKGTEKPETAPQPSMFNFTESIERFLFTVDHLARTSDNATSSAIAAVMEVNAVLGDKPQDAIDYFNRTLPDVKNDAVRRVVRLQLAELYRQTRQPDKALEQLRELMILAPAGGTHTTHPTTTHPPAAAHPAHPAEPAPQDQ